MANSTEKRSFLGKILFVVGIIIILIILAFLIINFVPRVVGGLANVGSAIGGIFGRNDIEITASETVIDNGDAFTIAWDHSANTPGSYGVTYGCTDNVEVQLVTTSGTRDLTCGTVFTLGPTVNQVTLQAELETENSLADIPVQVYFTENGATAPTASGQIFITVQDGDPNFGIFGGDSTITAEPTDNVDVVDTTVDDDDVIYIDDEPTTGGTTPVVASPADLAITNVVAAGRRVIFTVSNVGGTRTGTWVFNYTTPTNNSELITSPLQISLAPGQAIQYTLTFGEKDSGNQQVIITADPFNGITELSETNNRGVVVMPGGSFGNTGGNNNSGNFDDDDDADFVIEDLEVGRLSGSRFIEDDRVDEGDDVAIRFTVRNRGGETTDDWRFEIDDVPFDDDDDFRSREYDRLRPGEFIEITVEFENVDEGRYDIEVNIDSEDDTDEERESNNDDTVELDVRD